MRLKIGYAKVIASREVYRTSEHAWFVHGIGTVNALELARVMSADDPHSLRSEHARLRGVNAVKAIKASPFGGPP